MIHIWLSILILIVPFGLSTPPQASIQKTGKAISLVVLGNIQDAASPHIGCDKPCCVALHENPDPKRMVVSLGIVDRNTGRNYLIEATPDIGSQLKLLKAKSGNENEIPDGIFLTHAHIGHYTGLMYLGREALGADRVAVYAMPKMKSFLENSGPWNQLVELENIVLNELKNGKELYLSDNLSIVPFKVPHRDEYSETVGYEIRGPNKKALFIPDIDKWEKWEVDIKQAIKEVDYAFLDGSFYNGDELPHRDMSEIPHPFMVESMQLFGDLSVMDRGKVHFIHFNHTNPVINENSVQAEQVQSKGFQIAKYLDEYGL